jgi:hypothetical protein
MWLSRRNPKLSYRSRRSSLMVEQLERRELLNGTAWPGSADPLAALPDSSLPGQTWAALPPAPNNPGLPQKPAVNSKGPQLQLPLVVGWNQSSSPDGEGYAPAQLRQAYGFNQIPLPAGKTFDDAGGGQTIAIIDGLDDPYVVADLQKFDEAFNIGGAAHDPTSTSFFKVVNENGGTTLPDPDNGQIDFGLETALDVEWAHAMAPGANILLLETSSPFNLFDLGTAIETAARQPGVSVISMSFGFGEFPTEYYLDNLFTTPAGHQGVSFIASAGDSGGFDTEYPAMSPNVLSIGGTTLPADHAGNPDRASEYAWSLGGGGISTAEAEPVYQTGVQASGVRTGPDLAYDSDINTGVAVYDSLYANHYFPGKPWFEVGGTSIAAPQISSLVAITNQLRVAQHRPTLDGPRQLLPAIYQIAATDPNAFHDIALGNNDYSAGPGYDDATGLGTPNAQYLVPDLVASYPTPPTPRTLYWTGDVSTNWDTPGNWSTVDPAVKNVPQSVLPTAADRVVVDLTGATILHDTANYDTISSFTVTASKVTLDIGSGTIDLAGSSARGTFRADQNGDLVTMEAGVLANAIVTSGTSLSTTRDANANYPELVALEVDGTVNSNQIGGNNGFVFQNGLILNGTINLGGNKDQTSVFGGGYWDPSVGNQDNNPETLSGSGTVRLGQSPGGDGLQTWGTLGTFIIGPGITIVGAGPGSLGVFLQTNFTGGFDFQGTVKANGGTLVIQSFDPGLYGWEPSTGAGWTNEGTITASGGATLGVLGDWINSGKIGVDAHSTILLGDNTAGELASDPVAAYDTWSSTGAVTIADGATVYVGGFLTADQYQGLAAMPGVTWHPAVDPRVLVGTLDNNPADNPASHGVLNATSTPLTIAGGTILGGTLKAGSKVQVGAAAPIPDDIQFVGWPIFYSASDGWMYNVTNAGMVNATGVRLWLWNVTNSGTISGNSGDTIIFQDTFANTGTIKVDGTSNLYLGSPAQSDPNSPPALADGSPYAWNPAAGTLQVADGATVAIGGLLTTDQYMALSSLPNVHLHPAQDTFVFDGWLDNQPADNPVTHGVLALTSATGPFNVSGAFISGGAITGSGTGALDAIGFPGPLGLYRTVIDSVTNNGTIAVSGGLLLLEGNVVNNSTLANSSGNIGAFFLGGGSFINNATVSVASGNDSFVSMINNAAVTVTHGSFSAVSLTNNGSIFASPGFVSATSLVNSGTISVSGGSALFQGSYDNSHGTISVDSTSRLSLGHGTLQQRTFPTFADGSPYAFDPSKVGTLQIGDGATLELGGLWTTDQWNAFPGLPGVSVHFASDDVSLTGWLDNSPTDNPSSGGVLALSAATGPLSLIGGYLYQGKITTSNSTYLRADYVGVLDNVELDGTLNASSRGGFGEIYVENNLTLNGTIVMPLGLSELLVGFFDNAADTISGTGTISMGGTSSSYECDLVNLSNNSLTIGAGITINASARFDGLVSEASQINVLGTVEDNTANSTLYTYGIDHNTGAMFQDLVNLNGGTLTGGTWQLGGGATWTTDAADITANAANLSISGTGTRVVDAIFGPGHDALAGLTTNTATGRLTIGAGYNFTVQGNFLNAGILEIAGAISIQGDYTQTAGAALDIDIASPTVYGTLTVSGTATLAGTLNVVLANGFTPALGSSFVILSFGARSGDFSAKNGLLFSPSEHFEADYLSNTLTLVAAS